MPDWFWLQNLHAASFTILKKCTKKLKLFFICFSFRFSFRSCHFPHVLRPALLCHQLDQPCMHQGSLKLGDAQSSWDITGRNRFSAAMQLGFFGMKTRAGMEVCAVVGRPWNPGTLQHSATFENPWCDRKGAPGTLKLRSCGSLGPWSYWKIGTLELWTLRSFQSLKPWTLTCLFSYESPVTWNPPQQTWTSGALEPLNFEKHSNSFAHEKDVLVVFSAPHFNKVLKLEQQRWGSENVKAANLSLTKTRTWWRL